MPDDRPIPLQGLKRKATWEENISVKDLDIIDEFCYDRYYERHYQAMAAKAMDLINEKIELEKIQAKLTCRAKDKDSLHEKLVRRNLTRRYQSSQAIFEDIADLAGVRIILYTPNALQRKRIEDIIGSIWDAYTHVPHGQSVRATADAAVQVELPPPEGVIHSNTEFSKADKALESGAKRKKFITKYIPKHIGYTADHYRVAMRADQVGRTSSDIEYGDHRSTDRVEIQVMSALNHAWAEAGHDVLYKQHAFGTPTRDEQRILDSLRGLVSSGDLLLEQFHESVNKRTYAPFQNRDEFGTFLRSVDVLDVEEDEDEEDTGQKVETRTTRYERDFKPEAVDIWFDFLVKRKQNYPLIVRQALMDLNYPGLPTKKIQVILDFLEPAFEPPAGFLVPFCLLYQMLDTVSVKKESSKARSPAQKYSIITLALTLLQTFAGKVKVATDVLEKSLAGMQKEYEGVLFVLNDPLRFELSEAEDADIRVWPSNRVQSAWDWFQNQSIDQSSICGMMFRLAKLGVAETDGADAFGRGCDIVLPTTRKVLAIQKTG
jgi:ppGpp synthetase/RelA/SpoT-type nucleotidyltranferase